MRTLLHQIALCLAFATPSFAQDEGDLPIIEGPALVTYVEATYPAEALAQGLRGEVGLIVEIDAQGVVTDVEVETPAGHGFDESAVAAVKQMRFSPARTAEGPVAVAFPFTYLFDPPPSESAPPTGEGDATQDTAADDDPTRVTVMPAVLNMPEAVYPPEALAENLEADVGLMITLSDEGEVLDAVVSKPAGHGFDEAALAVVKQTTFSPAQSAEGPVGVVFEFLYHFTLQSGPEALDAEDGSLVTGLVLEAGTRKLLQGAIVRIEGSEHSTLVDDTGHFALEGVPAGHHTLLIRAPDHLDVRESIEVVQGEVTDVKVFARAQSYAENEAVGYYEREQTQVTRYTVSIAEAKKYPGTFGDPVRAIMTLPGIARSPFGTGLVIIRGANPMSTQYAVDGVEIPIVFHLTGWSSVISDHAAQSTDYLPGGYGTYWGRTTAGIVNINSKEKFEDRRIYVGADLLNAKAWFEGNFGKNKEHGFAIGARRSYVDALIPLISDKLGFTVKPYYWDYQMKYIAPRTKHDSFSVFVFGFQDIIKLVQGAGGTFSTDSAMQGNLSTTYQSHRIVLRWVHTFNERLSLTVQPSGGLDIEDLGLGQEFRLSAKNPIFQLRMFASYRPHDAIEIVPGFDLLASPYRFDFNSPFGMTSLNSPLAESTPMGFYGKGTAWFPAPYLELRLRPLKDRDRWVITPGIRYDNTTYFINGSINDGVKTAPTTIHSVDARLGTRFQAWRDDGDRQVWLKASTGLYHQPPQPFQMIGVGTTAHMAAERSFNSSLGIEASLNQAWDVSAEGFYRWMDNLVIFNDDFTGFNTQPFKNGGQGYAAGVEIMIRKKPIGPLSGWISYTFSRSFRRDAPDLDWIRFDYDQPHIFNAVVAYTFPYDITLGAQAQVVSGNPFTPKNAAVYDADSNGYTGFSTGPYNSARMPPYAQVSFQLDKLWTFNRWQLNTYVGVLNAIRGVNPESTIYSYDYTQYALLRGLPVIPNIGIEFIVPPGDATRESRKRTRGGP